MSLLFSIFILGFESLKLRHDEIKSKNIREQIVKNSPEKNEDYFVVPKVIE